MSNKKLDFRIGVATDGKTGEVLAVFFQVRKGTQTQVVKHGDGAAFANYDKQGNLLSVLLIEPCTIQILDETVRDEPEKIRKFLRRAVPLGMVIEGKCGSG